MSHQTGIEADAELKKYVSKSHNGEIRMLKIVIKDESLKMADNKKPNKSWESDYDNAVLSVLEENCACYIFYRLDVQDRNNSYQWIFMAYTPDTAPVKDKMLYSATKATIRRFFGGGFIKHEMFGTVKDDLSLEGYKSHLEALEAPPPLSAAEQDLLAVKEAERQTMAGSSARQKSPMHGLSFPLMSEAQDALLKLKAKKLDYVQLKIDMAKETIELADSRERLSPNDLKGYVPEDTARYHFYMFSHKFREDYLDSIVFIYSCPGFKCSIKERMLYSSCKNTVIDQAEVLIKAEVDKKIEVDSGDEISEQFLMDEVHPQKVIVKPKFAKPKPPGRGPSTGNLR